MILHRRASIPHTNVVSPLTGFARARLETTFDIAQIIEQYRNELGVDVSNYFTGMAHLTLYRCLDTQYRFFHPASLVANNDFYNRFANTSWYYPREKWEYAQTLSLVRAGNKILDVG